MSAILISSRILCNATRFHAARSGPFRAYSQVTNPNPNNSNNSNSNENYPRKANVVIEPEEENILVTLWRNHKKQRVALVFLLIAGMSADGAVAYFAYNKLTKEEVPVDAYGQPLESGTSSIATTTA